MSRRSRGLQESYRRSALFLSKLAESRRGSVVQVSSAMRREGTTTVVLTLARHLVEFYGVKVLVIEIGRHGDLARLLDLDPNRGFDSYADGRDGAADAIQWTAFGVAIVTGGSAARPVADFTARLTQLLKDVALDFDLVLLDVPPVLESTEALVLGALVPQMVLVVEAGRTRYEIVQRAQRELEGEGVRIIATVLNRHRRFIPGWIYRWLNG